MAPAATTATPAKNTAYDRRQPARSPNAPAARLATVVPAISAVSTTPTSRRLYPRDASSASPVPGYATPFDMRGAALGHYQGRCSFENALAAFDLTAGPASPA